MPRMNDFNDRYSSVKQMQSPEPSLQSGWMASDAHAGGSKTPTDSLLDDPSVAPYASRKVTRHDWTIDF